MLRHTRGIAEFSAIHRVTFHRGTDLILISTPHLCHFRHAAQINGAECEVETKNIVLPPRRYQNYPHICCFIFEKMQLLECVFDGLFWNFFVFSYLLRSALCHTRFAWFFFCIWRCMWNRCPMIETVICLLAERHGARKSHSHALWYWKKRRTWHDVISYMAFARCALLTTIITISLSYICMKYAFVNCCWAFQQFHGIDHRSRIFFHTNRFQLSLGVCVCMAHGKQMTRYRNQIHAQQQHHLNNSVCLSI